MFDKAWPAAQYHHWDIHVRDKYYGVVSCTNKQMMQSNDKEPIGISL